MSIKRASLKIFGYICGVAVSALIIYAVSRLIILVQLEGGVVDARQYVREDSFKPDTGSDHNTALFYLFSMISAVMAGFFALLSIFSPK